MHLREVQEESLVCSLSESQWIEYIEDITTISFDGNVSLNGSAECLFARLDNVVDIKNLENLDTSNVTSMQSMFNDMTSLTSIDVNNFDTSNVINMRLMFEWMQSLTSLDISSFDTTELLEGNDQCIVGKTSLNDFKIGENTYLSEHSCLRHLDPMIEQWRTVGTGTVDEPNGDFTGTSED